MTGFEPAASCSRSKRSAKLSYTPPDGRFRDRETAQHSGNPVPNRARALPATTGCKIPAEITKIGITKSFHDVFEGYFPSTDSEDLPRRSVLTRINATTAVDLGADV